MPLNTEQLNKYIQESGTNNQKLAIKNLMDVYADDWDHIINQELAIQFKKSTAVNLRPLKTKELNLIKKVTNDTALVYKEPAMRAAVISEGTKIDGEVTAPVLDDNYTDIIENTDIDVTMKTVNKMTKLSNQCLLKVNWRNQNIEFDVLTFDNVEIATDPENWKKIVTIKYYVDLVLPEDQRAGFEQEVGKANPDYYADGTTSFSVPLDDTLQSNFSTMFLWTLEDRNEDGTYATARLRKYRYQQTEPFYNEEVTYKDEFGNAILPFILFYNKVPVNSLLDFTTGNDLWDANLNTALSLVHLNQLLKYQSYKLISITTSDPDAFKGELDIDAQTILKIYDPDGNADVEVLDIQTNINNIWQVIRERVITALATRGVPPSAIRLSGTPQSGFSILLDKSTLLEMRQDDIQVYRQKEKELFKVIRIVNNTFNTTKINDQSKFKIDFAEIKTPESPEDKAKADTVQIMNNTKTPIDFIMRDNPDLDRDEATIIFNMNKAINGGTLPQGAELTAVEQPIIEDEDES